MCGNCIFTVNSYIQKNLYMKHKVLLSLLIILSFISFNVYAVVNQTKVKNENKYKNLKVLPQDISEEELKATMKFFNTSLGVKCSFCHVANPDNPKDLDFASDDNHKKLAARYMMKMTQEINDTHFKPFLGQDGNTIVPDHINCMTCHNGQQKPITTPAVPIPDVNNGK